MAMNRLFDLHRNLPRHSAGAGGRVRITYTERRVYPNQATPSGV